MCAVVGLSELETHKQSWTSLPKFVKITILPLYPKMKFECVNILSLKCQRAAKQTQWM